MRLSTCGSMASTGVSVAGLTIKNRSAWLVLPIPRYGEFSLVEQFALFRWLVTCKEVPLPSDRISQHVPPRAQRRILRPEHAPAGERIPEQLLEGIVARRIAVNRLGESAPEEMRAGHAVTAIAVGEIGMVPIRPICGTRVKESAKFPLQA